MKTIHVTILTIFMLVLPAFFSPASALCHAEANTPAAEEALPELQALDGKRFGVQTELSLAQLTGTMPDGSPTLAAKQAERSRLAAAAKLLMEYGLTLTPEQLEALGWTEGQYEAFIEATAPEEEPPAGRYGPAPEEKDGEESEEAEDEGKDGKNREKPGAPFQLMGSWLAALRQSDDPISVLAQIRASQWYAKMSPSQRAQLAAVLSERGLA